MSIELTSEILSAHADQLNRGEVSPPRVYADMQVHQRGEINALMQTATRAKRALVPVAIAPAFRARLRDGLTMAAQHKESQNILLGRREPVWGWVIGAAALGSAAGLIAIAWHARHTPRAVAESRTPALQRTQSSASVAPEIESSRVGLES